MNTPTPDTGTLPGTALETLGSTFAQDLGRDAIHLATVAVTSKERLFPGQHVGLVGEFEVSAKSKETVGIVDPFISGSGVQPGQHFWLVLYPRTITGLRHVWTHPAFKETQTTAPKKDKKKEIEAKASEEWLRAFCSTGDCPEYETVMKTILEGECINSDRDYEWSCRIEDDAFYVGGRDAHGEIPPEFWTHVENVLGFPPERKPSYFSCSC